MSFGTHFLRVDPDSHYILTDLQVRVCWRWWKMEMDGLKDRVVQCRVDKTEG